MKKITTYISINILLLICSTLFCGFNLRGQSIESKNNNQKINLQLYFSTAGIASENCWISKVWIENGYIYTYEKDIRKQTTHKLTSSEINNIIKLYEKITDYDLSFQNICCDVANSVTLVVNNNIILVYFGTGYKNNNTHKDINDLYNYIISFLPKENFFSIRGSES